MNIEIRPAGIADAPAIAAIGYAAVELAHRESCSPADMKTFLDEYYNIAAIVRELHNGRNNYRLLMVDGEPAGFSNIVQNAAHPNLDTKPYTKLDRIYLLSQYYDLKLGHRLLQHNIDLAKGGGQAGMWLFTWKGNKRAIDFYKKAGFRVIGEHNFKITENHYNPNFQMLLEW